MPAEFCELSSDGVIRVRGTEAVPFLHAQLTSDVAGLAPLRTQYAAYCTPQGRALAAFLLWRLGDEILLELPESVRESVQTRLSKYVLRANVKVARGEYRAFGVWGSEGHAALAQLGGGRPAGIHDIVSVEGIHAAQLGPARFIVMAGAAEVARARSTLERCASEREESAWTVLDIAAGIPRIVRETQEQYVPQMLNLDALGGVSYTKGCYPGQEIVARTRYLGRLKQRMYRIRVPVSTTPQAGDRLYSARFGADQASGAMLYAGPTAEGGFDALAVIQTSVARPGELHWKALDGVVVELKDLPYPLPE